MEEKGDVPEKDEVRPDSVSKNNVSPEAKFKAGLVKDVLDNGGVAHVYFSHTPPGEDKHLYDFNTHVYEDLGLVYWHAEDEDHWAYTGDVEMVERHYKD